MCYCACNLNKTQPSARSVWWEWQRWGQKSVGSVQLLPTASVSLPESCHPRPRLVTPFLCFRIPTPVRFDDVCKDIGWRWTNATQRMSEQRQVTHCIGHRCPRAGREGLRGGPLWAAKGLTAGHGWAPQPCRWYLWEKTYLSRSKKVAQQLWERRVRQKYVWKTALQTPRRAGGGRGDAPGSSRGSPAVPRETRWNGYFPAAPGRSTQEQISTLQPGEGLTPQEAGRPWRSCGAMQDPHRSRIIPQDCSLWGGVQAGGWGGRTSREALLWTDHKPLFLISLHHLRGEKLGLKEWTWVWDSREELPFLNVFLFVSHYQISN